MHYILSSFLSFLGEKIQFTKLHCVVLFFILCQYTNKKFADGERINFTFLAIFCILESKCTLIFKNNTKMFFSNINLELMMFFFKHVIFQQKIQIYF